MISIYPQKQWRLLMRGNKKLIILGIAIDLLIGITGGTIGSALFHYWG